jgi:hypothetical protein
MMGEWGEFWWVSHSVRFGLLPFGEYPIQWGLVCCHLVSIPFSEVWFVATWWVWLWVRWHWGELAIWWACYLVSLLFGEFTIWRVCYLVSLLFGEFAIWWVCYLVSLLFSEFAIWWVCYLVSLLFGEFAIGRTSLNKVLSRELWLRSRVNRFLAKLSSIHFNQSNRMEPLSERSCRRI